MSNNISLGDLDMAYTYAQTSVPVRRSSTGINVALWIVPVVLGVAFAAAGPMKLFQPISALAASLPFVATFPPFLVRFIGASELACAVGLVLPAATRIAPGLTPFAGAGLTTVMVLASVFHVTRGELNMLPPPMI